MIFWPESFGAFRIREGEVVGGLIYTKRIALDPDYCITPGK